MNASQLFADINTGALTEVERAANSFYSEERGLTVRQQFFIYPDDTIVALNYCDGSYAVLFLSDDNVAVFQHRYSEFF
jgi:hypothetical protein